MKPEMIKKITKVKKN